MAALTPALVERWIASDKWPLRRGAVVMSWEIEGGVARWRCVLANNGLGRGTVLCVVKQIPWESWHFSLILRKTEVLRWDFDSREKVKHRNTGCPPSYPGRVRQPHHEHQWVEGRGTDCAIPLVQRPEDTHREAWEAFASRARIRGSLHYVPVSHFGEPLRLFP